MNKSTVIIIGTGFGGQCAAINLLKQGIDDFVMLERRGFMGGTWCQNTYPGAAVDVQSPLYSLSFEPYKWSQMFAEQSELEEYTNHVIEKYQLRDKAVLNTNVEEIRWDEDVNQWKVQTSNGEFVSQFLINASGPLSTPVIPNFKGKDTFNGESFHTNNWNQNYDYKNKRVAIIGSGASAAQVIPAIAPDVKKLHVFQRTPHWVLPRADKKFSSFQRKLLGVNFIHKLVRWMIYWGLETRVVGFKYSKFFLKLIGQREAENFIKKSIKDEELRKKVTPDFTLGCKRVLLSNTLYPTYEEENVSLHVKDEGVQEITESGIITKDGQLIKLDLIVYATGYDATDGAISYPVYGKQNLKLQDFWNPFPRAYLGTSIPKFPNLFIVTGPNTGIGHTSAIFIIEAQMHYMMKSIKQVLSKNAKSIEVKHDSEEEYTNMIHSEMEQTVWKSGGCNSWYQSKSGHIVAMFPGFSFTYLRMAKNFKPNHHIIN
ncbi:MAG: flavin-containing monooxygenase [Flavobacteriales bacterium]